MAHAEVLWVALASTPRRCLLDGGGAAGHPSRLVLQVRQWARRLDVCYNYFMEQSQPLHVERHGASFNMLLVAGLVVAVLALFSGGGIFVIVGLGMAAFAWLRTPTQYTIFNDRLQIMYGRPRVRNISFGEIEGVEFLKFAVGSRVRLVLNTRPRSMLLQPRSMEDFTEKLQSALDDYRRDDGARTIDQPS